MARVDRPPRDPGGVNGRSPLFPFCPAGWLALVPALLRRAQGGVRLQSVIRVGDLEINTERYTVTLKGKPLHLTPSEFELLAVLARHAGQIMTRQQLMEDLYGGAVLGVDRSVDSHIKNLRRKLETTSGVRFIETVYGVGYRFVEEGSA